MFAQAKLADLENRVKPDEPRQRETGVAESTSRYLGHRAGRITNPMTSTTSTARCGPACRVVWEGSASLLAAPIPIACRGIGRILPILYAPAITYPPSCSTEDTLANIPFNCMIKR